MVKNISKILIIELWGIGDAVMMSAVLKPLRAAYPNARITVLCQGHGQEVLKYNREISSFVTYKFPWTAYEGKYFFWKWDWKGIFSVILALRHEKFDLILDGRGDIRDDFLAFLIGAERYFSALHQRRDHRVDCWESLLKRIDISAGVFRPSIAVSPEEHLMAQTFVRGHFPTRPRRLVGIHPGASHSVKRWPLSRFKELAERIMKIDNVGIILFSDHEGFGSDLGKSLNLPVFAGNIRELTALLARLDLFICNDTGVMHIASALDVPVVAIFGPGDPRIFRPIGGAVDIVNKECKQKRPCYGKCGKKTADCLLEVTIDDVWGVVSKRMAG